MVFLTSSNVLPQNPRTSKHFGHINLILQFLTLLLLLEVLKRIHIMYTFVIEKAQKMLFTEHSQCSTMFGMHFLDKLFAEPICVYRLR